MSSLKITSLTEQNTCNFCKNALARYSCPKCNQLYCTLSCYQSEQHVQCSEQFYKQLVEEHLHSQAGDDSNKEDRMQEILKRFHEENQLDGLDEDEDVLDSDDDANVDDLGARLTGIDLDDSEEVWKHLTPTERQDFEAFLLSGDVAQFMAMWTPWWEFQSTGVLDPDLWKEKKKLCPSVTECKRFEEISNKPPAKCVENNLINLLSGYVFLQRYFNGEVQGFEQEFVMFLFNLSLNLKENVNFDTAALAIESIFQRCLQCSDLGITTDQENQRHVKDDINSLLAGPHASERKFYLLSALSDIKMLFTSAKSLLGKGDKRKLKEKGLFFEKFTAQQTKALGMFTKDNVRSSLRKIDYYLAFVNDVYLNSGHSAVV